jgi:hypothetical protein
MRCHLLALAVAPTFGCAAAEPPPTILVAAAPTQAPTAAPLAQNTPEPRKSDVLQCPTARDGNRTYAFCQFGLTWHRAEAYCRELHGHLVTIHDRAEDIFIFLEANKHSHDRYWIGLNDIHREGTFEWASGSPVHYTRWAPGEPNDAGGNEDCVQINRYHPSDEWNDEPCDQLLRFVCEIR